MEIFWLVVLTNVNATVLGVLFFRQRRLARAAESLCEALQAENTKLRNRLFMAEAAHVAMQLHQYEEFKRHHANHQDQPSEASCTEAPQVSTDN